MFVVVIEGDFGIVIGDLIKVLEMMFDDSGFVADLREVIYRCDVVFYVL